MIWDNSNIQKEVTKYFIDENNIVKPFLSALKDRENIILEGCTGTAKTYLLEQVARATGQKLRVLNMQVDTTADSLKGKFTISEDNKIVWVNGAITEAMRNGELLVIEEINFINPDIASILYSVLDYRRNLILDEKNHEVVEPHKDFRIVATRNPEYAGTNRLNPALENRFTAQFTISYLSQKKESAFIMKKYKIKKQQADLLTKYAEKIRKMREEFSNDISTRAIESASRRIKSGSTLEEALNISVIPIIAKDIEEVKKARVVLKELLTDEAEKEVGN